MFENYSNEYLDMLYSHRATFVQCLNELTSFCQEIVNHVDESYIFDRDYDDYCNPDTLRLHESNSCQDCRAFGDCGVIYDFDYKLNFII
jgi:hypothetical protein